MLPLISDAKDAVPVTPVATRDLAGSLERLGPRAHAWAAATGFKAEPDQVALLPDEAGGLARVLVGWNPAEPLWALAALPDKLPERAYALDGAPPEAATPLTLGWALGGYAFIRYKARKKGWANLVWPTDADRGLVERLADGICLARDLINTPTEDMGPADLAAAAQQVAAQPRRPVHRHRRRRAARPELPDDSRRRPCRGRGREPRLIDITWGDASAPKVTLVGKGVCFDTGGLDLKPASGMRLMKKDMGGAATMLGLAHAIMAARLPVRLRVLVPAVENSVSGNAIRPMDIVKHAQGPDGRDWQHRRRGPADPVRRARRGRHGKTRRC